MLSAAYPRYCSLLVVGYQVGTREGESLSIQWPQVDLRANEIRLKAPTTKKEEAPHSADLRGNEILAQNGACGS